MGKMVGRSLTVAGALLALALAGCGDGGKESPHRGITAEETGVGKYGVDAGGVGYVGVDQCEGCHGDVDDPITTNKVEGCTSCHAGAPWAATWAQSGQIVEKFLESGHVLHSDRIDASAANAGCNALCHDPVGDGRALEGLIDEAAVPARGLAAVTCEACHGGGGRHFGKVGAIAKAPDHETCGGCHNETMPSLHAPEFPEGLSIRENYTASRHARTVAIDPAELNYDKCLKCHTDEGAKAMAALGVITTVSGQSQIQCRTCHDAHKPAVLLGQGAAVSGLASPEYNTCTFCHEVAAPFNHTGVLSRMENAPKPEDVTITDTHVATANRWENTYIVTGGVVIGTSAGTGMNAVHWSELVLGTTTHENSALSVTGYAMTPTAPRVCQNCHNPHQANVAEDADAAAADPAAAKQHHEWASSKHADRRAVGAWSYYDWSLTSRQACQRCHTTSGASRYLTALETGRPYSAPFAATTPNVFKPEMLQCWGCHKDNAGGLRRPGPITADYSITVAGKTTTILEAYPDVAGSNICVSCHDGRLSGRSVEAIGIGTASFQNSHYLGAAGTLFQKVGYDFGDRVITTYNEPKVGMHQLVGTPSSPVAGAKGSLQGPCVGCHMTGDETHAFEAVVKDEDGHIVAFAEGAICTKCHSSTDDSLVGGRLTAASLETERKEFKAAMAWLETLLAERGAYFYPQNPYMFKIPYTTLKANILALIDEGKGLADYNRLMDLSKQSSWPSLDAVGAAFNFNYLEHEPGAYVHQKAYVKQLLQWSIDWAYDGVVDNDFEEAKAALPAVAPYVGYLHEEYNATLARDYFKP